MSVSMQQIMANALINLVKKRTDSDKTDPTIHMTYGETTVLVHSTELINQYVDINGRTRIINRDKYTIQIFSKDREVLKKIKAYNMINQYDASQITSTTTVLDVEQVDENAEELLAVLLSMAKKYENGAALFEF